MLTASPFGRITRTFYDSVELTAISSSITGRYLFGLINGIYS